MKNDAHVKWKKKHGLKNASVAIYEDDLKILKEIAKQEGISVAKLFLNSVKEKYAKYFEKGGIE